MTIEYCMLFLIDYLDVDKYFKVNYPEHNLVRSKFQLKLSKDMVINLIETNIYLYCKIFYLYICLLLLFDHFQFLQTF